MLGRFRLRFKRQNLHPLILNMLSIKYKNQKGFAHPFLLLIVIAVLAVVVFAGLRVHKNTLPPCQTTSGTNCDKNNIVASKSPSACKGKGPATITAAPIALT